MPVIHIEYDCEVVSENDAKQLAEATHKIVSKVTGIKDVPVYANSSNIRVKVSPIEIFIRLSSHKIKDLDSLTAELKEAIREWKNQEHYNYPINMTLIPMNWKIEIDV